MSYAPVKFEVTTPNGLGEDTFARKYIIGPWGQVVQYPLHHVSYVPVKFEVAMSNGLGGDRITRNVTDRRTMDGLWYEIDILFFSKTAGMITIIIVS